MKTIPYNTNNNSLQNKYTVIKYHRIKENKIKIKLSISEIQKSMIIINCIKL